jgi:hypothetical protein
MALTPLPSTFGATVRALHAVAEQIVAPARKPDNEIALMATPGGFGTPPFEHDGASHQVRVEGADLVDGQRRAVITSLEEARGVVAELVPRPLDDAPLDIDIASAVALADVYAFGADVLREIGDEPVILWPEHFDIATVAGTGPTRANYGLSPGDEHHDEPYLYVGPWAEVSGELWNAKGFAGAELTYSELLAAPDQRAAALDFLRTRKEAL